MSILFSSTSSHTGDPLNYKSSKPIDLSEAKDLMDRYQNGPREITFYDSLGVQVAINCFTMGVGDVKKIIANLGDLDQVFIAFGKRANNSHTLVVGGCIPTFVDGVVTERELKYHPTDYPLYDYCDPCPPACPR